jgi:transglutaminase-like putative cysteine protease
MSMIVQRLPKLWIGLSLFIWGGFTGYLPLAIGMAVIAEFGTFTPYKWDLSGAHFYRVADFTCVLFAGVAIYQFNEHSIYGIYEILALLPLCIFPLLVCEKYTTTGAIPLSALFLSLRRRVQSGFEQERFVGVAMPFVLVCALAACTGDTPPLMYLGSVLFLLVGLLFSHRSIRYKTRTWVASVITAGLLAFAFQTGIRTVQSELESSFSYWFNQLAWLRTDPDRTRTAIGSIGRLKFSDRIRVRLFAPLSIPLPVVLHEASYTTFNLGTWSTSKNQFAVIDPERDTDVWVLSNASSAAGARDGTVVVAHPTDIEVTPLPYGARIISGSEVIEVQRSNVGTTLVEAVPGQFEYHVSWDPEHRVNTPPTAAELAIPDNYLATIRQVADEIGLDANDSRTAIKQVVQFFSENYKYSLIQKDFYPGRTPLSYFLLSSRQGHCEYFATSTALLLRYAGIPTRYAVGYFADEYSSLEKAFVARARDAHSWTEAFVDNEWITVDTTPSEWAALEGANASSWQTAQDIWSWLSNRLDRFQRTDHGEIGDTLLWFVPPLVLVLIWRLRHRIRKVRLPGSRELKHEAPGVDSELYELATILKKQGFDSAPGETLATYLKRNVAAQITGVSLLRMLELHYKHRFANRILSVCEREELRRGSQTYCDEYVQKP